MLALILFLEIMIIVMFPICFLESSKLFYCNRGSYTKLYKAQLFMSSEYSYPTVSKVKTKLTSYCLINKLIKFNEIPLEKRLKFTRTQKLSAVNCVKR